MSKVLYQYIVTYYERKDHTYIEYRDILTENYQRHDGPYWTCITGNKIRYIGYDTEFHSFEDIQSKYPQAILKFDEYGVDLNRSEDYDHKYLWSDCPITHQYVVTYTHYLEKAIRISWKDILTNRTDHHYGPALITLWPVGTSNWNRSRHEYFKQGAFHRLDGPAEEWLHQPSLNRYFIEGKYYKKEEFEEYVQRNSISRELREVGT